MCGIHGIISRSDPEEEICDNLFQMGKLQRHRGPDAYKNEVYRFRDMRVGFGFERLSILDLQTGMQPIKCEIDNSVIICNGQVYNYLELKHMVSSEPFVSKGDIEVALHLYRKKGVSFLDFLNGMYGGAIYDPLRHRVLLFRDRFGIKPLYYTEHNGNFVFASEIKPVLQGSKRPPLLNQKKLGTFFSYRYLPGNETMFKGVFRLPPGSFLDYDLETGKYNIVRYWEYSFPPENRKISIGEAEEEFCNLFSDAVSLRLRSDVEVGCFLSGGIDSSAVAQQAAFHKSNIKLFSISFAEPEYDELPLIKNFISANNKNFKDVTHHTGSCGKNSLALLPDIIRCTEDPISLGALLPTDHVCRLASNYVKVVLTGEGADEIFGGYRKFLLEMAAVKYPQLSLQKQKDLDLKYPELAPYLKVRDPDPALRYIQSELLFTKKELGKLIGQEAAAKETLCLDALPFLTGEEHPVNAAICMESRFRLPDYVILRLDKLSMRHSLEARTPFLDYRLAEFAATLPADFKINLDSGEEKFICRRAFAHSGILDRETASRKKQPFTIPLPKWLSEPDNLPEFFKEIMWGNIIKKQGVLNPDMVHNQIKKITSRDTGPSTLVSEADRFFAIAVFTIWYSEFITGLNK